MLVLSAHARLVFVSVTLKVNDKKPVFRKDEYKIRSTVTTRLWDEVINVWRNTSMALL